MTEIGFEQTGPDRATLTCVLTYQDAPGFIGLCAPTPTPSVPRLIRYLLEDPKLVCSIGDQPLSTSPTQLLPGDFPWFQALLLNPARELPIIYISPNRTGSLSDLGTPLVSPCQLAAVVATNAMVFYSLHMDFSLEMSRCGRPEYACLAGSLRVYMPHPSPEDCNDQYRHRYLPATQIERLGEESVIQILRRALAQDVHFYETVFRVEACRRMQEADRQHLHLISLRANAAQELTRTLEDTMEELEKREAAEAARDAALQALRELKIEYQNLEL